MSLKCLFGHDYSQHTDKANVQYIGGHAKSNDHAIQIGFICSRCGHEKSSTFASFPGRAVKLVEITEDPKPVTEPKLD